jgi:RecA-family ATPase
VIDLASHIGEIARHLLGEPNRHQSTRQQLRFGKNGSIAVEVAGDKCGSWYDHENQIGGTAWDLVREKAGIADVDIPGWLDREFGIRPPNGHDQSSGSAKIIKAYDYHDESGRLLFQVCRLHPKTFRQRRPDGKGGWDWSTKGTRMVPYRLPELIAASRGPQPWRVYICEGEKDADRLGAWGLTATANPAGAGKWRSEFNKHFAGADAVVIGDNDEAGRQHAVAVATSLKSTAASVRVLELEGVPEKGDFSDWADAGALQSDLETLVEITEPFELLAIAGENDIPALELINPVTLAGLIIPERRWLVPDWVPMARVTGLYGAGGEGKTLIAQMLATACAIGAPWLGLRVRKCNSLLAFCEDDLEEMHRRQDAINQFYGCSFADLGAMRWAPRLGYDNALMVFENGRAVITPLFDQVRDAAKEDDAELIIADTLADIFMGNENDRAQARAFAQMALGALARETHGAIIALAHPSRTGMNSGSGESGSTAWIGTFRSQLYLSTPKVEEGEPPAPDVRVLTRKKSNAARRDETIDLRWRDGVFISTTETGILGSIAKRAAKRVFRDLVDRMNSNDRPVSSNSRSGNYAPKLFAMRPDREGYGKADFERAMEALFADGELRNVIYGRAGDARQRIVTASREQAPNDNL